MKKYGAILFGAVLAVSSGCVVVQESPEVAPIVVTTPAQPRPAQVASKTATVVRVTSASLPTPTPLPDTTPTNRIPPKTPPPGYSSPSVAQDQLLRWAIQTHMDEKNFSTGGIDGKWGSKSGKALKAWQQSEGLSATGTIDETVVAWLGDTNNLYTTTTVTAFDHAALTPYPSSWLARSQQSAMGFESIEEMMAERYHLYRAALRQLNPSVHWPNPAEGTVLTVPNLHAKRLPKLSKLTISLSEKSLQAFDANGKLVAHFPCSIAADKAKRPSGTLHVVVWAENPDYTFDPKLFLDDPNAAHIDRKLRIPPGPNNPVGVAWIGLDLPGYGIHGTPAPESISHTESHGCFRLTNWDAKKLVRAVYKDLPVEIVP